MGRKITIEPVTRVEGHGKVTIRLDDAGRVWPWGAWVPAGRPRVGEG
jgi:coenzyme F420-reducing hydrogenase alpha subunit